MPPWITLILAILQSPAVQEAIRKFFEWIWQRLEQRFGPVPAGDVPAFRDRLDLVESEVPWYRPFMRMRMRRIVAAMHRRAAAGEWHPIEAGEIA